MPLQDSLLPEFPAGPDDVFDVVLVSGDAYVDHPAFGTALVGRFLESLGYRVGILAQPDWTSADDFRRFGRPRLLFGVSAGNLDSIVAHYTPDRRRRNRDDYSPGGQPGRRPDYASVVYAQRCREAYPEVPVVMGGVEASLRRLAHYDYIQQKVRRSVLVDAKADYLVYGMAERTLEDLARGLARGDAPEQLQEIRGLAYRTSAPPTGDAARVLPAFEAVAESTDAFLEFFRLAEDATHMAEPPTLVQPHGSLAVVVNPPARALAPRELDHLYELPFTRTYPERYAAEGGIPALEPVRFSLVTHRGCYGGCSFCAITAHQGRVVVSRTPDAVVAEAQRLTQHPEFRGTIQDVGGPTANMYATACRQAEPGCSGCERRSCLNPEVCPNLEVSGSGYLTLLRAIRRVPGVKHAFVASGLRYDLLLQPGQRRLLRELMQHHVGGQMKVAPEHVTTRTLRLMGKGYPRQYREFADLFRTLRDELDKPLYLIPYLMTGHPGCDMRDATDLARFVKGLHRFAEQIQDFTPTPMTRSTCMFWTGHDPDTGERVHVPIGREKKIQRALAQFQGEANRRILTEHFETTGRTGILHDLYGPGYKQGGRRRADGGRSAQEPGTRARSRAGKPGGGAREPTAGKDRSRAPRPAENSRSESRGERTRGASGPSPKAGGDGARKRRGGDSRPSQTGSRKGRGRTGR